MKLSFRWYGETDPVSLTNISQIPAMRSVVSAVYDVKPGEIWPEESIAKISDACKKHNLIFDVVESIPVHEEIKLGTENAAKYIDVYKENIRRVAKAGVKCICYNFMPVFDWTRTQLDKLAPDGSTSLVMYKEQLDKLNPLDASLSLPGWDSSYDQGELQQLFSAYKELGEEGLWKNLETFLKEIIPTAQECGVNMAIHPDDPPYSIFGLPRIITNEKNLDRFLKIVDVPENGLTFCTGCMGSSSENDVPAMARKYSGMGRIHFVHMRNVRLFEDQSFEETAHLSACGTMDMHEIAKALSDTGFDGYIRPDHGRMIWGETGRPGYGLFDRALGAAYINGLFEALDKR